MAEKQISILLVAKNLASGTIGKVTKDVSTLGRVSNRAGRGLRSLGDNLTKGAVVGAAALGAALVSSIKIAGDFEAQMNTINTVAGLTKDQLGAVGDGIRKLARDTGTSLDDLTAGYYDLVSAGVAAGDAQGVLTAANTLAVGGLATTSETIDLLTTALNSYGLKATEAGNVADMFAQSIAAGKVTAADLAASFAQVGSIAASSGIGINELAAGYAQLTAKGVPAAEAATQMKAGVLSLLKPSADLNSLQKKTGINFAKLAKNKGLVVALERMRVEAAKAKIPFVDLFGRVEAYNLALATTGKNLKGYQTNLDLVNKSEGVAAKQAAERKQGLDFQILRIKALARDAAITIGSKLLPKITPMIEKLAAFIDAHQADIESFGDDLAKGFEGAATWAAKLDWKSIGAGLKAGAGFAQAMVETFAKMPPEAMGAILALGGLNKLTGGALGDIAGELGKGLVRGVLGLNAGVVNLKAGVVNGAGGGGVGGKGVVGKGGGILGKVGGAVMSVAIVAMAAEVGTMLWGVKEEQTTRNKAGISALESKGASFEASASTKDIMGSLAGIESYSKQLLSGLTPEAIAYQLDIDGVQTAVKAQAASLRAALQVSSAEQRGELGLIANAVRANNRNPVINVNPPVVNVRVGFTIRELQAGIKVSKSYAGGYGSR